MPDTAAAVSSHGSLEDGLAAAQAALSRGDLAEALGICSALRQAYPTDPRPFLRPAAALVDSFHLDEAEMLLETAVQRFPNDPIVAIDNAWLAHRRRDVAAALRRWEHVRTAFPDHPLGYTGAAVTLRDNGQYETAGALLRTALERFPDDAAPVFEVAWLATARRDWPEAMARWEIARTRFPDQWMGYSGSAQALRELGRFEEAEALLQGALERFADFPNLLIEHAWIATARHDWPEALRRWESARERFPARVEAWSGKALALREMRRFEDADAVLAQAIQRFPNNPNLVIDHAWIAHIQREWPTAILRWEEVRRQHPGQSVGFISGTVALREARRIAEAEVVVTEAMQRFPDALEPLFEHAWLAQAQGDWAEAAVRWERARARAPDRIAGYLGQAAMLREQGRQEEAEALLRETAERFPDDPTPRIELGWLAVHTHRVPEAIAIWAAVRDRFPDIVAGYTGGAIALRNAGQFDESAALLQAAVERFPNEPAPVMELAWLAHAQADHAAAARQFAVAKERFPDQPVAFLGLGRSLRDLGHFDEAEQELKAAVDRFPWFAVAAADLEALPEHRREWTGPYVPPPEAPAEIVLPSVPKPNLDAIDPARRDLVQRFESLGGSPLGSEFAMVQRACGAEPLGLLRWADMSFDRLLAALVQRFAGVGAPDNTELFIGRAEGGRREYCTRDRRFGMETRSFLAEDEVPAEQMRDAVCRRQQFLTRKLIETLERGDRILVYRAAGRTLSRDEVASLHAAIRAYGDSTLLVVCHADADHPGGTVERTKPGLLIGYMDQFAVSPTGEISAVPVDAWLALLENAVSLPLAAEAPPVAPRVARTGPVRIVVCGFHLANQIATILARLPPMRERISVQRVDPAGDIDSIRSRLPERWLETADLFLEESQVGNAETRRELRAAVPAGCAVRSFSTPNMRAMWPFFGPDSRLVPEPPAYNGGRYPHTDPFAARLAGMDLTDDALFDTYMEMTEAATVDLDRLLAADVARWQAEDRKHDVQLAAFLEAGFRATRLFTTPYERGAGVLRAITLQLFATPVLQDSFDSGTLRTALDRLMQGWLASRQELPVHPRVARHFGLEWWSPDLRYRMLGNRFTFRDYIIRYIRWSPWLT